MQIENIQKELRKMGVDGWLFYDFHGRDHIAARILKIPSGHMATRRWFYFIPSEGSPIKLNHKIEPNYLNHLPGEKELYLPWQELRSKLETILNGSKKIAMQYSPNNDIPYVSIVDAGTIELIRGFGVNVVSSGNLVSLFESHLTDKEIEDHRQCGYVMQSIKDNAFKYIRNRIDRGNPATEYEVQQYMHQQFRDNDIFWDHGPIVGINEHAGDPHFEPTPENSHRINEGDLVLIDLFARFEKEGSIFYDVTWMGYVGNNVPDRVKEIFKIATQARDAGLNLVKERYSNNETISGAEVDDAVRKVIVDAGYGEYYWHRTGHNIATDCHGNGAHIDNLETKDDRLLIKGTIFSIEPGIYIPEEKLGFRTEIDVIITNSGEVEVAGEIQKELVII
ncbi:MAG: aminopeptidase P family protein [Ignavibacteriae bacterium]|nr:aminopeptidase P family protein [Ignavibacteriota bacterium]MCB9220273.1 aminopeptidase P family protein [Ignavibacteria bacterium]